MFWASHLAICFKKKLGINLWWDGQSIGHFSYPTHPPHKGFSMSGHDPTLDFSINGKKLSRKL